MATIRRYPLVTEEIYHIFNKSIAGYRIFNNEGELKRMKELFSYYCYEEQLKFYRSKISDYDLGRVNREQILVKIIAYCIMPTHIHLILQQCKDNGISIFMSRVSNSYARYFNIKYGRKGPLWEGSFKNVLVNDSEQLLHLTRYLHLNPTTAFLVEHPQDWIFSSYREYLGLEDKDRMICSFNDFIDMSPTSYKRFVEDRIDYQRDLERIKHLLLEE
ncbi:MAG: transposase [Candidatus Omnitrophica bacterium]|nr:transposase [Candidatus Omnitrophota bacterium]